MEIDFCIETSQGIFFIEAKNRDTVVKSDFTSMTRLAATAGELWLGGIVACRGNKIVEFDENLS